MRDAWRHTGALTLLGIATVARMWPILSRLTEVVPGAGPGDNLTFVWNLWWMREALARPDYTFFRSPLIFHPFGVDLTLNTHTALPAFVAAVVAPTASLLAVQNVTIGTHLFLNAAAAYALAFRTTRHVPGSILAAAIFSWSPYAGAHLQGHFNLIAMWPLPLAALFTVKTIREQPSARWTLGIVLAATVYIDYYIAIYAALVTALLGFADCFSFVVTPHARGARWQRGVLVALMLLLLIDAVVIAVVGVTGGGAIELGAIHVSATSINNPITVAGILATLAAAVWIAPKVSLALDSQLFVHRALLMCVPALIVAIAVAPLAADALSLWQRGEYVTQKYLWRSAPAGVDVATLLLGHPYSLITGTATRRLYDAFRIDPIEQSAWLGPGVIVLCAIAVARRREIPHANAWLAVSITAALWALGPYLRVFGNNTSLMLPATAIRYLPLISNARIPARAIVLVYLSAAVLAASGVAAFARDHNARRRLLAAVLMLIVVVDYIPAPPPWFAPHHPPSYDALRLSGDRGAVLELPLGLRDGFGETGRFDSSTLYYQTIHRRPLFGGFVARLPPSIITRYRELPVIGSVLRLSEGGTLTGERISLDRDQALTAASALDLRFVVVDRARTSADLRDYIHHLLPLRLLAQDDQRDVYVVEVPPR